MYGANLLDRETHQKSGRLYISTEAPIERDVDLWKTHWHMLTGLRRVAATVRCKWPTVLPNYAPETAELQNRKQTLTLL